MRSSPRLRKRRHTRLRRCLFDLGAVHLLTTASLKKLGELYPEGSFDPRRFRPNLVLKLGLARYGSSRTVGSGAPLASGTRSFWK
jgi:uncharacterized protein YcbX